MTFLLVLNLLANVFRSVPFEPVQRDRTSLDSWRRSDVCGKMQKQALNTDNWSIVYGLGGRLFRPPQQAPQP
jgi:hypothetical protein